MDKAGPGTRTVDVPVKRWPFDVTDETTRATEAARLLGTTVNDLGTEAGQKGQHVQWFIKQGTTDEAAFVVYRPWLFPNRSV